MTKIFKVSAVLILLILLGSAITWHYLPTILVKAIAKENSGFQVIPISVKKTINKKAEEIPMALKSLESEGIYITIDDIIKIIDESNVEEITKTIDILEHAQLQSTDQVIRIALDNMDFGKLENEKVIAIAKQKMKMSDVKRALKMIRENGKPYVLTIPLGKETIKGILLEKEKEIEKKLNS